MTTRITIRTPDEVGEAARALQQVNRQRLEDRQRDAWAWRDTLREIRDRRAKIDSRAARANPRDPWRGAVPEFEEPGFTPVQVRGKRFQVAGGYLQKIGDRLEVRTPDGSASQSTEFLLPPANSTTAGGARRWGILLPGGGERLVFVYSQDSAWQSEPFTINFLDSHKSFIVTRNAVNIVNTPAPLQEIGFRYNGRSVLRQNGQLGVDIAHFPYTLDDILTPPSVQEEYGSNGYLMLLRSFGYGELLTLETSVFFYPVLPPAQSPNWGTTPAIFSFLKNYDGEFHQNPPVPDSRAKSDSYTYIRDKYFPQDAPSYMLTSGWQVPEANVDTTDRIFYFKTPNLQNANIRSLDSFRVSQGGIAIKPNRGRSATVPVSPSSDEWKILGQQYWMARSYGFGVLTSENAPDPIPLATWDWNRPLACIYELLDLGFTAEDLMLTEAETAALAAADPAAVRFKF